MSQLSTHAAVQPGVSLIIPTLNEAENLAHVLPTIPRVVDELIIVDGDSTDGTLEVVETLRPDAVIVREGRLGKGHALRSGFEAARGDIIVMMDADGSMAAGDITVFVAALQAGADVVKGSRYLQGGGSSDLTPLRSLGNLVLTQAVRVAFGGRYSDLCYGYMAFWRHVLPTFQGDVGGFEVETFLNIRALAAGLHVVEVATFESPRLHGESHLRTFRDGSRVLRTIVRERRRLSRARASTGVPRPYTRQFELALGPAPAGVVNGAPAVINRIPSVVNGTPAVVNGTPAVVNGTPAVVNGTPAVVNGTPAVVNGTPAVVNGTPASVNGASGLNGSSGQNGALAGLQVPATSTDFHSVED